MQISDDLLRFILEYILGNLSRSNAYLKLVSSKFCKIITDISKWQVSRFLVNPYTIKFHGKSLDNIQLLKYLDFEYTSDDYELGQVVNFLANILLKGAGNNQKLSLRGLKVLIEDYSNLKWVLAPIAVELSARRGLFDSECLGIVSSIFDDSEEFIWFFVTEIPKNLHESKIPSNVEERERFIWLIRLAYIKIAFQVFCDINYTVILWCDGFKYDLWLAVSDNFYFRNVIGKRFIIPSI